ncbi:recombinase family protein [Sphingomonas rubra]|uniref:recombinase family protein n=1 Tax=Sphingomonas rubra TaxID=634430 RepID=UPI000B1AA3C1|nr:recombinase family protein [Sphingomonas rubra]
MAKIAYYRVSTTDQSVEMQRNALGGGFDREFNDIGLSGSILAAERPGCAAMLDYIRDGDILYLYALDRLGRDALDVQQTVRLLLKKGVHIDVRGIGLIASGVGEVIVAVLAQLADLERQRINERCAAGRVTAKEHHAATGRTHRGKTSLGGRPNAACQQTVVAWRREHQASISQTMARFNISKSTVARYCAA